jgi:hypothetical protein
MTDSEIKMAIEDSKSGKYKVFAWGCGDIGQNHGYEILSELGIKIDFYCDNNSNLYGKEIKDGILCINPQDIPQDTICFVTTTVHVCDDVAEQLRNDKRLKYVVTYMDLCIYMSKNYFECQRKNQIVVYSCIVGGYDEVMEPKSIIPNCDYYLISDVEKKDSIYKFIDINNYEECKGLDNTRINRYFKINAHKIFPNYRYSIYHDGHVRLDKEIIKYIDSLPITKITACSRLEYSSIYTEAYKYIGTKRDKKGNFVRQIEKYWNEGMPDDFGLVTPCLMVRQHNHPVCRKLMEEWWDEVLNFSRRDMISLPYVLWKNGYSIEDVNVCSDKLQWSGEGWELNKRHIKKHEEII